MQTRAEKAAATAVPMVPKRDLSKEVGLWRMSVGNTSADNWSPYPTVRWTPDPAVPLARLTSRQAARQPKSPRQNEAAEKIKKKNNRQRQWQKKYSKCG
ncbi:MAG: hypothetical protein ACLRM8_08895 [Alistipes sp.]